MTPSPGFSRRSFLKGLAGAVALPMILPSGLLAGTPPSEKVRIASIGLGAMGTYHLNALVSMDECRVVALCDTDSRKTEGARAIAGLPASDCTRDFHEILARDDVDAVNIATPDHWHVPLAIAAIKAGKAVYVQKPVSLTIEEGRVLADLAAQLGAVVQVGSQQRSSRNFRFACELVRNGYLGDIKRIEVGLEKPYFEKPGVAPVQPVPTELDYDRWLGPAPWKPYTWQRVVHFRGQFDYSGGYYSDWGAHHLDIVQWALGRDLSGPVLADGKGTFQSEGIFDVPMSYFVRYEYDDGIPVEASERFKQGIRFEGTEGWLFVSRTEFVAEPAGLLSIALKPGDVRLMESENHLKNFFAAVRTGSPVIVPPETGHRSATMCHLGNLSMRLGRPLEWDPVREEFRNDAEANRLRGTATRSPWRLG